MSRRFATVLAVLLAGSPVARLAAQQQATLQLAEHLLMALAPERDDVEATVLDLLGSALAAADSPAAEALAAEARARIAQLPQPQRVVDWLAAHAPSGAIHGLLADELRGIAFELARRGAGAPIADPFPDRARRLLVVGPFGDVGKNSLDVPFAPDVAFPAAAQRLPGRFGDVAPRLVERAADRDDVPLQAPERPLPGSYYALWCVRATAAANGFLEIALFDSFWCALDGRRLGRSDWPLVPGPPRLRLPVRLTPGLHRIVVKTGGDGRNPLRLRFCDATGAPLAAVTEVVPDPGTEAAAATAAATEPADGGTFRTAAAAFAQAAESADGDARGTLRVAAAVAAQRSGDFDRVLATLIASDDAPPPSAVAKLVLADLWLQALRVPDEQKTARARALQTSAIAALPPTHLHALLAKVRQLEDQDQREAALRLLRAEIDAGRAGPRLFAATHAIVRRLRFVAEEEPLLLQWVAAVPGDPRPRVALADRRRDLGAPRAALALLQQALPQNPFDEGTLRRVLDLALDLGDFAAARQAIELAMPASSDPLRQRRRAMALLDLAQHEADAAATRQCLQALAQEPGADAATLAHCADCWLQLGDDAQALTAIAASLRLDSDQPRLLELQERLGGPAAPGRDFARFRRDGDAAIAAFQPGPSEREASSTMLVDQSIVEILPDGATLAETHELRRINDLDGVEALRQATDPANADEVLLLRTVGTDGRSYLPARVQKAFAMPRLEPGAFVEWRYRRRTRAVGAAPLRLQDFLFASRAEPLRVTEWVVIVPDGMRGSFRRRNLPAAPRTEKLDNGRTAYVFTRTNVSREPQEDSPPPAEDVLPIAGYGEDADPRPGVRGSLAGAGHLFWPTPPIVACCQRLLDGAADDRERLRRLDEFCQREIADGEAWDATEVLLRKKGMRFALLVALLRAAGLPVELAVCERARPELGDREQSLFLRDDLADVRAAVLSLPDQPPVWLFVDVPRHWPAGAIPAQRAGALAFRGTADGVQQTRLPATTGARQDLALDGTCTVGDQAVALTVKVRIGDFAGYSIADQLRRRTADVQKIAARQIGQQVFGDWRIRTATTAPLEPGGQPIELQLELERPAAQTTGDGRWLLPLPLPTADLRQNFGDRDERTLPLRLTHDLAMRARIVVDPGPGRAFAELPPPLCVAFALLDYELVFSRDGDRIVVDRRVRLRPGTIDVALYAEWVRWLAAIDQREQQRLALVATDR